MKYLDSNNSLYLSPSCKFTHDIKKYLEAKEEDLGDRCPNFDLYGEYVTLMSCDIFDALKLMVDGITKNEVSRYSRCHYGYKCRFLKAHMDANGNLIKDEEKVARVEPQSLNVFSHDLTLQLRGFKAWI